MPSGRFLSCVEKTGAFLPEASEPSLAWQPTKGKLPEGWGWGWELGWNASQQLAALGSLQISFIFVTGSFHYGPGLGYDEHSASKYSKVLGIGTVE